MFISLFVPLFFFGRQDESACLTFYVCVELWSFRNQSRVVCGFDYARALNDPAGGVSKVIVKQQQPTE